MKIGAFVFLPALLLAAPCAGASDDQLAAYGWGVGAAFSNLSGDYVQDTRAYAVGAALEAHAERWFLMFRGYGAVDRSSGIFDAATGYGNRWIKAGFGFVYVSARIDARADTVAVPTGLFAGLLPVDPRRKVWVDVRAFSPYVRLSPVYTQDTLVAIDAWYSATSSGTEHVPVNVLGFDAELVTDPVKAGGFKGVGLHVLHRVARNVSVSLQAVRRTAKLNGATAGFQGDIGLLGTVRIPDLLIRSSTVGVFVSLSV